MDNINRQFLVNRHLKMAEGCIEVIKQLKAVERDNKLFFIETGGYSQLEMYENEVENQLSLSKKQGEYHGLESV